MPVGLYTGAQISIGNGVTTVFPYGWKILDQTHVEVKVDGVVKALGADYTVSGVGASNGGNVTFVVAPANLAVVQRARKVPYKRDVDYQANGDFKEETVDSDFDLEEMQVQQIAADITRAFKAPLSVTADQVLTDAMWAARMSMFIGFDGAGNIGVFSSPTPGALIVSAFIQTLLDDADAATARNTLGAVGGIWPLVRGGLGFDASGIVKGGLFAGSGAGTVALQAVGTDGKAVHADSSQASGLVYLDNPSRPNLLINPNWQIDQINEGALYTVNAADVRGPDGWSGTSVGAGVFKLRTLADPDNAALKCLEITCTTIDAAIAAADDYFIYSAIEGYDAAALMAGTAAAQPITVQFKFKSNVNGLYGVSIANSALNRRYIGSFTVADAAEHEYTVSLTLDTTGTWLYTNGVGLYLRICLAAGANFQGAAAAWAAGAEQTTAAQVNFMSNIANVAYLKRVQLIPGALVQAYKPADIGKELAKAQRQYWKTFPQGTAPAQNVGNSNGALKSDFAYVNAGGVVGIADFPAVMRAAPSVVTFAPDAASANWSGTVNRTVGAIGDRGFSVQGDTNTGIGNSYTIHATATARLS